jgi:hypothetical protein
MKITARILSLPAILLLLIALSAIAKTQTLGSDLRWFKGNTHSHTLNSDGDSTPDGVVKWYRESGYNFVFITDHEYITGVSALNDLFGRPPYFAIFTGQEITGVFDRKPFHVNGLGLGRVVMPKTGKSGVETMQFNIDAVRAAGGVPQINHPNFGWALTAADISKLENVKLMEIFNGHPTVNNLGGGGSPSVEEIWDEVLTAGRLIYGIAVDDSHYFKRIGDPSVAAPGRGWIVVRAAELDLSSILSAMENGDFYSSTGIEIAELTNTSEQIEIKINATRWSKYTVRFIGSGGRVLSESFENPAVYRPDGTEGYVRAKILESNGKFAWTQPVLIPRR